MGFFGKVRLEQIRLKVLISICMSFLSFLPPSLTIYVKFLQFFLFYDSALCFQDLSEIFMHDAHIRVIYCQTFAILAFFLIQLSHFAIFAEERPMCNTFEVLSLFDSFGYFLWHHSATGYCLGDASVADVRNRSFLPKMRISLLEYFFTLWLSFYLERL